MPLTIQLLSLTLIALSPGPTGRAKPIRPGPQMDPPSRPGVVIVVCGIGGIDFVALSSQWALPSGRQKRRNGHHSGRRGTTATSDPGAYHSPISGRGTELRFTPRFVGNQAANRLLLFSIRSIGIELGNQPIRHYRPLLRGQCRLARFCDPDGPERPGPGLVRPAGTGEVESGNDFGGTPRHPYRHQHASFRGQGSSSLAEAMTKTPDPPGEKTPPTGEACGVTGPAGTE